MYNLVLVCRTESWCVRFCVPSLSFYQTTPCASSWPTSRLPSGELWQTITRTFRCAGATSTSRRRSGAKFKKSV